MAFIDAGHPVQGPEEVYRCGPGGRQITGDLLQFFFEFGPGHPVFQEAGLYRRHRPPTLARDLLGAGRVSLLLGVLLAAVAFGMFFAAVVWLLQALGR